MKRDTHILKFVNNGRTFRNDVGVKCFPEQTYGISQQSPDQMKLRHTFKPKNGYIYRHDDNHQANRSIDNQQQIQTDSLLKIEHCDKAGKDRKYNATAFSQRRYCSVVGQHISDVQNFKNVYNQSLKDDNAIFGRKKGRLSEFMDKNGWMNKTEKIMGFQRSDRARLASNKDRERRISSLVQKNKFNNPVALKPYPKQARTSSLIYSQKAKIRGDRFSLLLKNQNNLQIQRPMLSPRDKYLEAEQISNKLGRTMIDKNWYATMSTIRKKSNQKPVDKLSLTCSDWRNNYKTIEPQSLEIEGDKDELKEWFNSTCNSSANPWKYRKPRKVDTQSSQEYNDNDN